MNALEMVCRVLAERMVGDAGRWRELLRDDSDETDPEPSETADLEAAWREYRAQDIKHNAPDHYVAFHAGYRRGLLAQGYQS